ncbi:hypothetical protein PsYK624_118930 [Phanerochaete sordida]|uniref:F-box domain-containing protein n=1 Tax=Phanerochaete sordida TaxID=48140 RepID=A0A9P3GHH3_9APHY|nr:hypothetical protein PsYK624_118930 [Phanerochaete sordida]
MHHALQINEIVQHVAGGVGTEDHQTLLHLALVCHAFFDPAMDVRWRILYDIDYIIQVSPEDVFGHNSAHEKGYRQVAISRSPSEHEWQRLAQYARPMRVLECSAGSCSFMDIRLDMIAEYGALLPDLHTLYSNALLPSPLFLRPPLHYLNLKKLNFQHILDILDALPGCGFDARSHLLNSMTCFDYSGHLSEKFADALLKMKKLIEAVTTFLSLVPCDICRPARAPDALLSPVRELKLAELALVEVQLGGTASDKATRFLVRRFPHVYVSVSVNDGRSGLALSRKMIQASCGAG